MDDIVIWDRIISEKEIVQANKALSSVQQWKLNRRIKELTIDMTKSPNAKEYWGFSLITFRVYPSQG